MLLILFFHRLSTLLRLGCISLCKRSVSFCFCSFFLMCGEWRLCHVLDIPIITCPPNDPPKPPQPLAQYVKKRLYVQTHRHVSQRVSFLFSIEKRENSKHRALPIDLSFPFGKERSISAGGQHCAAFTVRSRDIVFLAENQEFRLRKKTREEKCVHQFFFLTSTSTKGSLSAAFTPTLCHPPEI